MPRYASYAMLVCALGLVIAILGFVGFVFSPGPGEGTAIDLDWNGPATVGEAADTLAEAGLVRSAWMASLYLLMEGNWDRIDSGAHLLQDDMSPRTLVRRLRRVRGGVEVRVTIPEGFDKFDIADRLHEAGVCSRRALLAAAENAILMAELHVPAKDAEGYLFPATYSFSRNQSPTSIVRRMVNETVQRHADLFDRHAGAAAALKKDLG